MVIIACGKRVHRPRVKKCRSGGSGRGGSLAGAGDFYLGSGGIRMASGDGDNWGYGGRWGCGGCCSGGGGQW